MAKKTSSPTETIGTKAVADHLGITSFKLRTILRSENFFPDNEYTRYSFKGLDDPIVKKIAGIIESGASVGKTKSEGKKSKKSESDEGKSKKAKSKKGSKEMKAEGKKSKKSKKSKKRKSSDE